MWIMPPLFGWNRFILEGFGTSCTFDYVSKDLSDRLFILLLVTGGFLIPLAVILLSYSFILFKLSQRSRGLISKNDNDRYSNQQIITFNVSQLNLPDECQYRRGTEVTMDYNDDKKITRNMRRTEFRATRTALLVCAVFCAAWGPYALMALLSLSGFNYLVNAYTTSILGILTKVAACANPLIYAISLNGFREQICSYAKCICRCNRKYHQHLQLSNPDLNRRNLSNLQDR